MREDSVDRSDYCRSALREMVETQGEKPEPVSWPDATRQAGPTPPDEAGISQIRSIADSATSTEISANNKLSLWQATKLYPRIIGYCLGLSSAILLYGYDLVIVGTVSALPQFQ